MKFGGRILIVALVILGTFYLAYWLSLALIPLDAYSSVAPIVALVCAALAGRYVWIPLEAKATGGLVPTMLLWAVIVGSIGFVAGFVGPIIFAPEANQGPLLGIFITGPLGFLFGGIAGFVCALRQQRRNRLSKGNAHAA